MTKEAVFTLKLEPALRDAFMAAAQAAHRPASQLVRDMMRDFISRQQETEDYDSFLRQKVAQARTSLQAGHGISNTEVEAAFAARRAGSI